MAKKVYKHNDYYGYLNKINEIAISNPKWFWSDDPKASKARQWLYNNGAEKIVKNIFDNTPDEMKSKIDPRFLSKNIKDEFDYNNYIDSRNRAQTEFLKNSAKAAVTGFGTAASIVNPITTIPALLGAGLARSVSNNISKKLSGRSLDYHTGRALNRVFNLGKPSTEAGIVANTKWNDGNVKENEELGAWFNPITVIGGGLGIRGANVLYNNRIPLAIKTDQLLGSFFKKVPKEKIPLNLGWAPSENSSWYHQSDAPIKNFTFPNPENWAAKTHNAPSGVIYLAEKPANSGFLSKRKYTSKWDVSLKKPMVQVGEVKVPYKNKTRNDLIRFADSAGSDGLILNGINDNQLSNQKILLDLDGSNYTKKWEIGKNTNPISKAEKLGIPKGERNQPLNGHLKGDKAVEMFQEYGGISPDTNSEIYNKLKALVPEARQRYGLTNNTTITDDSIINSLYKRTLELSGASKEPILLFRGDTKRYKYLLDRPLPDVLAKESGTMDNSLGNLFLGDFPKGDTGAGQYIATAKKSLWGEGYDTHLSNTGKNITLVDFNKHEIPEGSYILNPGDKREVWKLPGSSLSSNANDINPFVIKDPNVRDASSEISVLADPFLIEHGDYYGPKLKIIKDKNTGFPSYIDETGNVVGDALYSSEPRDYMAKHYNELLKKAKSENQNILLSNKRTPTEMGNIRTEHTNYDYYAVPNYAKKNLKHLFGWDLRKAPDWNSNNIYLKNGGKLK